MNPAETQELSDFVIRLNKEGLTIVVIEHDMKFRDEHVQPHPRAQFRQKICEGTPEIVRNDRGVNEAYFGQRARGRGGIQQCLTSRTCRSITGT